MITHTMHCSVNLGTWKKLKLRILTNPESLNDSALMIRV